VLPTAEKKSRQELKEKGHKEKGVFLFLLFIYFSSAYHSERVAAPRRFGRAVGYPHLVQDLLLDVPPFEAVPRRHCPQHYPAAVVAACVSGGGMGVREMDVMFIGMRAMRCVRMCFLDFDSGTPNERTSIKGEQFTKKSRADME